MDPSGVLLYPKPAGVTSHDVVASVRRGLGGRVKTGHAGTLDPFATGLLLVLVGQATRAQRFFVGLPKSYRALARLGWISDTGDPEGRLERTGRMPADLGERLSSLTGEIHQHPPAYSALKVGGEPLYRRARRGEAVEAPPRPVTVYRFALVWRKDDRACLEVECSAGTYVRQLVAELGDAYCEALERTAIGPFALEHADEERVVPLSRALGFLPERALEAGEAERVAHGAPVRADGLAAPSGADRPAGRSGCGPGHVARAPGTPAGPVRLTRGGRLLAVAERRGDQLKPVVVFAP